MRQTKFERIDFRGCASSSMNLRARSGWRLRRGGDRSLAVTANSRDEIDQLVGDVVRSLDAGAAELKLRNSQAVSFPFAASPALDFDYSGGTEISPGEFLLARPDDFYGAICGAREASGFQSGSPVCFPP